MKIHSADTETPAEKYKGSPHVFNALKEGRMSLCGTITEHMDTYIYTVTCKGCINVLNGLTKHGTRKVPNNE